MRHLLVAVMILFVVACSGPATPTSEPEPNNTPTGTPEAVEPTPSAAQPTQPSSGNTLLETPGYTGVIFSKDGASKFSYKFGQASTGFWEPSAGDVSQAEACITQFLVSAQENAALDGYQKEATVFILDNLKDYLRQYVGLVVNGEKRIWCNMFLTDNPWPFWQTGPVDVDDGGKYYWQIEYILPSGECTNFYVHGVS